MKQNDTHLHAKLGDVLGMKTRERLYRLARRRSEGTIGRVGRAVIATAGFAAGVFAVAKNLLGSRRRAPSMLAQRESRAA